MSSIHTLILDIYALVKRKDGWFTPELSEWLSKDVSRRLQIQLGEEKRAANLRLSKMGPTCPCALWYSIHHPELAQPLPPWAEIKYSYGHILEALTLTLAKASGHLVTGEQDELVVDGIHGHRDAVIDGCIVDVKSCSSRVFSKFKDGIIRESDSFGYLDQLDGYLVGSLNDDLVTVKDKAYILAIDKTLGHMLLYEHRIREERIRLRIRDYRDIVAKSSAPACTCKTTEQGKSGNLQLDVRASYSPYKYSCFPHLRTFLYSNGPVYLTKIVRKPDVPEIDKFGNIIG